MAFIPVFVRSGNNYDMDEVSALRENCCHCTDKSLTIQSQAEDADINVIVRRFGVTGEVPITHKVPTYQDFDGVFDYRTAVEAVMRAEDAFAQVPAHIRARFHNDPGAFVDFCMKAENNEELRKMGLANALPADVQAPKPEVTEENFMDTKV